MSGYKVVRVGVGVGVGAGIGVGIGVGVGVGVGIGVGVGVGVGVRVRVGAGITCSRRVQRNWTTNRTRASSQRRRLAASPLKANLNCPAVKRAVRVASARRHFRSEI
eukprot:scaffold50788_cov68-Phaeocystis_antarctica.AAC.5